MRVRNKLIAFLLAAYLCADVNAQTPGELDVIAEFVGLFDQAVIENSTSSSASTRDRVNLVPLPGIFLHPMDQGDARLEYPRINLPRIGEDEHLILTFATGIRDGVEWKGDALNGVRFAVHVNGEKVHESIVDTPGWKYHTLDLDRFGGEEATIALHTNAIEGDSRYDWAVFGDPLLLHFRPGPTKNLAPDLEFKTDSGKTLHGYYTPKLEWGPLTLSSPILLSQHPFDLIQIVKNVGRGQSGEATAYLVLESPFTSAEGKLVQRTIPSIESGDSIRVDWPELIAPETGAGRIEVKPIANESNISPLRPSVFPQNDDGQTLSGSSDARLRMFRNSQGEAYLIAEVSRNSHWERAADLYPLLEAVWSGQNKDSSRGARFLLEEITEPDISSEPVILRGNLGGHPAELEIQPTGNHAFQLVATMTAATDIDLYALRGPQILPWNHTAGPEKDFAIFGGVEYLEGDEHSSSERDLAYPLNLREVPAIHKIASPLMAVENDGVVVGTAWKPRQEWAPGELFPAARFAAPKPDSGYNSPAMGLAVPSVGKYIDENTWTAAQPYTLSARQKIRLEQHLFLQENSSDQEAGNGVLNVVEQYFEHYPKLPASAPPRGWPQTKQLALDGYFNAVWNEDPPGFKHCYDWKPGLLTGHIVPLLGLKADGVPSPTAQEIDRRTDAVLHRALAEQGPEQLWRSAGCHIVHGELPYYVGYLPEALAAMRQHAWGVLNQREDGLWRWHPQEEKFATLGVDGDHTLGQAARGSLVVLRAARLSADSALAEAGLEAMHQMDRYRVPRGAQTWECPLYQPDILAAGYAIRAYCEAFRLTGDPTHLEKARYWARTGLPFLYLWEREDYPTMRYNVISVMGSTFYSHSWIGLPVVWCGLVYAYALQDLHELSTTDNFDWQEIARGITHSAMWQQYTEGPNRGTYPDSWNMVENEPRPADINPENIVLNALRLRGDSTEVNMHRTKLRGDTLFVNAPVSIGSSTPAVQSGRVEIQFNNHRAIPAYALAGPLANKTEVTGSGEEFDDSASLAAAEAGWLYSESLGAVIIKLPPSRTVTCVLQIKDEE